MKEQEEKDVSFKHKTDYGDHPAPTANASD